jgi:sterol desaturase/sphingolipid hydroxylase (fatty acid hydroxylase superfamily)
VALLVYAIAVMLAGRLLGAAFLVGLLLGFAHYEFVHWRIHFRQPRTARQRRLRSHHLAHHFVNPRAYHGVTTRIWDRAFGSLPHEFRDDYARVADLAPLEGASNLAAIWSPRAGLRVARSALDSRRQPRNLRG